MKKPSTYNHPRSKPKTRTGALYGKSNSYDVPTQHALKVSADFNAMPVWAYPGINCPDYYIVGERTIEGECGHTKIVRESYAVTIGQSNNTAH